MSVVLGKRLRPDPSAKPLRHRAEVTGIPSSEDPLTRLCRLFPADIPRSSLAEVLLVCNGDFEAAMHQARSLLTSPDAEELVNHCAVAASLPEAAHIIEAGLMQYHGNRKGKRVGDREVEGVLRENAALKKMVRFLHEKLLRVSSEAEESERIRAEIERERQTKAALLFHLHRCHA